MSEAVFFDFDGTLLDSIKPNMLAFSYAFKKFGKNIHYKKILRFFGENAQVIVKNFFPKASKSKIKKITKFKDNIYSKRFIKKAKLFPGAISFLKFLNKSSIKVCLISQTPRKFLLKFLKQYEVRKYFSNIVGNDEVKSKKRSDMLLKACKRVKLKPSQVVYIGDSIYDGKAARKAKIKFFGVTTGGYSRKELLKYSKKVFKNIKDVFYFLRKK